MSFAVLDTGMHICDLPEYPIDEGLNPGARVRCDSCNTVWKFPQYSTHRYLPWTRETHND